MNNQFEKRLLAIEYELSQIAESEYLDELKNKFNNKLDVDVVLNIIPSRDVSFKTRSLLSQILDRLELSKQDRLDLEKYIVYGGGDNIEYLKQTLAIWVEWKDKILNILQEAPEEFDSLIEIFNYINNHITESNAKLEEINNNILNLNEKLNINSLVPIKYIDLKKLRDNNQLVLGQQYRITDYITTTVQENTQSAEHPFDIIVTADDINVLNEKARAIHHEGDTYFLNSNLNAWELKYCLDNDTERFAWANGENGKGVIYRMIDEFNNDCPYDFKNIKFRHPSDTETYQYYYYTFTNLLDDIITDKSLTNICYNNIIKECPVEDGSYLYKLMLNGNVFINTAENSPCHTNIFDTYNRLNSFSSNCHSNTFGKNFHSNVFGSNCRSNLIGHYCFQNTFGDNCYSNTFGNECTGNTFGNYFRRNSLANYARSNVFGAECSFNRLENNASNNRFGNKCSNNSLENNCSKIILGNSCSSNIFDSGCNNIRFATAFSTNEQYLNDNCSNNKFGCGCSYIIIHTPEFTIKEPLSNLNIKQGIVGKSGKSVQIQIATISEYETIIAKNSNGKIKQFNIADIIP